VADLPSPSLRFTGGCPDPGERVVALPAPLPALGDDFRWDARDYDAFRTAMLEDLAARRPPGGRRTVADLEVVLVEAFAAALAQLSDTLDRVSSEAYLETARRPASVRRLLALIGYDAQAQAHAAGAAELERAWLRHPEEMDAARVAGPLQIRTQRRMVTAADYSVRLAEHPAVARAAAWEAWSGAWPVVRVAIIAAGGEALDDPCDGGDRRTAIADLYRQLGLPAPVWSAGLTLRGLLTPYVDRLRMAGQEVWLEDAEPVPIFMSISLRLDARYYRSEVRRAVQATLAAFFRPGRLQFGEDVWESDVIQALTRLEGVEDVCLNRFKRLGSQYTDDGSGHIVLTPREVAVCDDDSRDPTRGYSVLRFSGGRGG
jgi:hypothetical protein